MLYVKETKINQGEYFYLSRHVNKHDVCAFVCVSYCEGSLYWSRSGDRISPFTEKHRPGPAAAHGTCNWTDLLWKWWVKLFLDVSELTFDSLRVGLLEHSESSVCSEWQRSSLTWCVSDLVPQFHSASLLRF